jgi:cell division protein ZapA (FtsZ GTPase activity inhibitor)
MAKGLVQIQLLGTSFTIQADEDPEYLGKLIEYINRKVNEVEKTVTIKDSLRISILTNLLITDELFKERLRKSDSVPSGDPDSEEVQRLTQQMIERLDQSLQKNPGGPS